ncbi:MAG: TetR/AcrR family transcriptional regulator [Pseudomonadota bacterium]
MSKRPPRQPRQERAKATVEAIVEAAFSEVAERGLQHTTAQHIADKAGVGIGSFYEYFPNKEAVFEEIFRRLRDDTVQIIRELTPAMVRLPVREAIRMMLMRVGEMLRREDGKYLRCAQHAMRSDIAIDREPIERELRDLALKYLLQHPEYLKAKGNPSISIYIFIHGGMHAFIHHMNERNPVISFDELIDGLANMIGHYLEREMQMVDARNARRGNDA